MKKKTIVFDFDGVIADTFAICYSIARMGDPVLSEDEYRSYFEGNINIAKLKRAQVRTIDFFAEFAKQILVAPLFTGIAIPIQSMANQYNLVVVSSTISPLIEKYLVHHDLRKYFQDILGNDISKSKVEKFEKVFDTYETSGPNSVIITDTLGDVLEAKEVNMNTVAVTWGYHPRLTLERGKPSFIVGHPSKIVGQVTSLLTDHP